MLTYKQMLLVQLAEECNEVAQRVAKCLRFGMDDVQDPSGGGTTNESKNNQARLSIEIIDLLTLVDMCVEAGLTGTAMRGRYVGVTDEAIQAKRKRVFQYMELSIKLGQMDPKVPYCLADFYKARADRMGLTKKQCDHEFDWSPVHNDVCCRHCGVAAP